MAIKFGEAFVRVFMSDRDFKRGLGDLKRRSDDGFRTIKRAGIVAFAAIAGAATMSVKKFANFEQAIANAASVTGKTGKELDETKKKLSELARELGATTVFSASQAAEAMYDLASKGFDPAKMSLEELQPFLNLAAATQSDLAMTTESVTSSINQFGLETKDSGRVADVFAKTIGSSAATMEKLRISMQYAAPVSRAAGQSLEQTAAILGRLYDRGFEASQAGTAVRAMLAELMSPSEKTAKKFEELGINMAEVDITSKSLTDVLRYMSGAGLTSADMLDIFGQRAGPAAQALLSLDAQGKSTIDSVDELTRSLEQAGGTAERMANQQLDTATGKLKQLTSAVEELQLELGERLTPMLTGLVEKLIEVVRNLNDWIDANPELATQLFNWGSGIMVVVAALAALKFALNPIIWLLGILGTTMSVFVGAAIAVTASVISIINTMKRFKASLWDVAEGGVIYLAEAFIFYLVQIKKVFDWVGRLIDRLNQLKNAMISGIGNMFSNPVPSVPGGMGEAAGDPYSGFMNDSARGGNININISGGGKSTEQIFREVQLLRATGRF